MPNEPNTRGVESVARAFDLLDELRDGPRRLSDLARAAHLRPSTAHRLISTLVQSGYVRKVGTGQYALGIRLWNLANGAETGIAAFQDAVNPYLNRIHRVSRRAANLFTIDTVSSTLLVQRANDETARRLKVEVGARLPSHATASGKVGLAFADEARVDEFLDSAKLQSFTRNTVTDPSALKEQLAIARARGYSSSNGEYTDFTAAVAAPILDDVGQIVGALGVSMIARDPKKLPPSVFSELGELVGASASEASSELGYKGPTPWGSMAART